MLSIPPPFIPNNHNQRNLVCSPSTLVVAVGLFKDVLKPLDDAGLDYWWIDFQHGPFTPVPLLNPTFACNYAWWTNPWRYGHRTTTALAGANGVEGERGRDRPFIMGRWGGLGGHRYPIGFAGDTAVKWKVLRYETYFSPTSSNVGFMWTHDIGGFEGNPPAELLTRWVQWGTFSPMLRTHSSKLSPARSIWHYPNPYFSVMRNYYRLRSAILPYLGMIQRDSYETGLQMMRPMYWYHPYADAAYLDQGAHQYYFGPHIWCAPIAAALTNDNSSEKGTMNIGGPPIGPAAMRTGATGNPFVRAKSERNGMVQWTVWSPPGEWIEWFSWQKIEGSTAVSEKLKPLVDAGQISASAGSLGEGSFISRNYSLSEMPLFSAPGTIIPMRNLPDSTTGSSILGLATQQMKDIAFWVFPVTPSSFKADAHASAPSFTFSTRLYDDDGLSVDYEDGAYHWTDVTCTWQRGSAAGGNAGTEAGSGSGGILGSIGSLFGASSSQPAARQASASDSAGGDSITCTIAAPTGAGYPSFPPTRTYSWRFIGNWIPSSVTVDGQSVQRDQPAVPDNLGEHSAWRSAKNAWAYHGPSMSTWVRIGSGLSTAESHTVTITFPAGLSIDDAMLSSGLQRKVARSLVCKDEVDRHYGLVYPPDVEPVLNISATAVRLSSFAYGATSDINDSLQPFAGDAQRQRALLESVDSHISTSIKQVSSWQMPVTHTVALTLQAHCLGVLQDAATPPSPLDASDARYKRASKPIAFSSDISMSKGSAPGQVSQYSGGEDDDEGALGD